MKRILSILLAVFMLLSIIPANTVNAEDVHYESVQKLDVVLLNDGQYMIKLPGVDYTMARQASVKPDINPTDNPTAFSERTVKVAISDLFLNATKIKKLTVIVYARLANYNKEYELDINNGNAEIKVPVPKKEYGPGINVTFDDGRDARYAVEANTKPTNVVNINIDFLGHTGVATRWYGTANKPDVKANYVGLNKTDHKFALPKLDQNTILRRGGDPWSWQGHNNPVYIETVPIEDIRCSDETSAMTIHLLIDGKAKGQLASSNYYFHITGDALHGFTATMREKNTVDFDAGDGTWKTAKPAQQFAANGLKLGESFMEAPDTIGPVTIPNGATDLTPPAVEAGKPAKKFVGWSTTKNGPAVDMATYVVTGDVTFYALYAEEEQGRVAVQYVDAEGNAILDKYKIKDEKYPDHAEGNKGKPVEASKIKEPKFIGYKRTADTIADAIKNKTYETEHIQTVEVKYKKLADIIPEKKNGQDNPDVTPEVKEHYAKVTFQVAAADDEKAKLQLAGADATSPLVYYVNPVEGIKIKDVASVNAVSKNTNLYKVDANDMWTYDPDSITGTDQVISQARDTQDNVIKTEITLTAKVADRTAAKFKDQLDPQDIKVWVDETDTDGSKIDWKKGVKVKDDAKDRANLVKELEDELAKPEAKVTDLGENGTINQPATARTSKEQNLPNGKKGNLKVTFKDGSSLEVKDQTLYVAPHKNDDNTNLPKDAVKVEFKIGTGVTGTEKTKYVKPGTDVKEDAPKVSAKEGFKDAKWYKGDAVATDDDYKVTAKETVFTAKATGKDKVVKLDDPDNPTNFPKDPTDNSKKDADYVTVKFVADANGKIKENGTVKEKGIAYAVLKNTKWADAVTAGVVVPTEFEGTTEFYSFKEWQDDGNKKVENDKFPDVKDKDLTYTAVFGKADELSVTYNLNAPEGLTVGGKAPKDDTKYLKDKEVTVKALEADNKLAGYEFKGWNTKADGKGTTYAAGAKFAIKANTELFAQWNKTAPDVIPVDNENDEKGKNGEEIPSNYVFVEFKVKDADNTKAKIKDGQQAKFKVDPKATVTLTAPELEVKDASYTASFNKSDYTNKKFEQATTIWAVVIEKLVRPVDPTNPDKKDDEVVVKFLKGEHGKLSGIALVGGKEENVTGRDALAYCVKKKDANGVATTWAAMEEYIPRIVADSGWRVANPSWNPILPEDSKLVEKEAKEFTAQYVAKPTDRYITLTLDENYRNGKITDYEVLEGDLIEDYLYIPRRRGYIFKGWSYDSRRLEEVRPGDRIYYPTTLYAIWTKQKAKDDEEVEPIDTRAVNEHKAYMFGYTDGSVRPNGSITRAEAAALVTRLLGIEANASSMKPAFTDTPSSWYNKAINAAVARGIMKGYPDGRFRPNAPITRAEFTQMIYTFDNKPYGVAPFADVKGHWAERAIGSEYQAKRITGYPDGLFRPDANITRAEAVVILNKIFERNYDAMSPINAMNKEKIKVFTDLHTSFWGFNDMVEATNTHLFKRRRAGFVEEDWTLVK